MTTLSAAEKKQLRAIAHNLNPIIIVGDKGVSEGLLEELDRALEQHELIKVKVASNDREFRAQAMTEMAEKTNATQVQIIGKIVVLLRYFFLKLFSMTRRDAFPGRDLGFSFYVFLTWRIYFCKRREIL